MENVTFTCVQRRVDKEDGMQNVIPIAIGSKMEYVLPIAIGSRMQDRRGRDSRNRVLKGKNINLMSNRIILRMKSGNQVHVRLEKMETTPICMEWPVTVRELLLSKTLWLFFIPRKYTACMDSNHLRSSFEKIFFDELIQSMEKFSCVHGFNFKPIHRRKIFTKQVK